MKDESENKEAKIKNEGNNVQNDKDLSFTEKQEVKVETEQKEEFFDTNKDYTSLNANDKLAYKDALKEEFMAFVTEQASKTKYGERIFNFENQPKPESFNGIQQLFDQADKDNEEKVKILYNNTNV